MRQATFLAALNAKYPHRVIARVESRKYASNQAVVVEYLRALVTTGKLQVGGRTALAGRGGWGRGWLGGGHACRGGRWAGSGGASRGRGGMQA